MYASPFSIPRLPLPAKWLSVHRGRGALSSASSASGGGVRRKMRWLSVSATNSAKSSPTSHTATAVGLHTPLALPSW